MIVDEKAIEQFRDQVLKEGPPLSGSDTFKFDCHPERTCFNRCCHDVNIFLTPYDVVRLKRRLGMTSDEFIAKHCRVPFSKDLKYPIVQLKMSDDDAKGCLLLDEPAGCGVYEDRPWSCRMYPVGRASAPPDSDKESFHFLIEEEWCKGCETEKEWTIDDWQADQGIAEYDQASAMFQAFAQDKRLNVEEVLSPQAMDMVFMVWYDLDRFRRFVFESKFLQSLDVADDTIASIKEDDMALMAFGFDWLRFSLWREPTMKLREDVAAAKKEEMADRAKQEDGKQ
jgi:Fe-S-cluster containining protein